MIAKFVGRTAAVLSLMAGAAAVAGAQTQTVNFSVAAINQLALSGNTVKRSTS